MAQSTDYSIQLPDAAAPVKGNAGELRIAAANSLAQGIQAQAAGNAQAIELEGQATAQTISFLGTQIRNAGKGFLEAKVSDEIKGTLDKLEGFGEGAKAAETNINQFATFAQEGIKAGAVDQGFINEASKYLDAQRSGVMTRAEVIARMGKTIKEYSALMPGMASDFRRVGAELTGIGNLDVYGVNKALTEKGSRERAAEQQQAADLSLLKEVAQFKGYTSLSQVTDRDRSHYQTYKALKVQSEVALIEAQTVKQTQEVVDANYHKAAGLMLAEGVEKLSLSVDKITELASSGTVEGSNAATQAAAILTNDIQRVKTQFVRAVTMMQQPNEKGGLPLSSKYAQDEILSKYLPIFNAYEEAVKNVEGRDLFKKLVDSAKMKKDTILNTFYNAHPAVLLQKDTGVLPELYKAYIAINSDDKEAERRFGKPLAEALKVLKNYDGTAMFSNTQRQVLKGEEVDTEALSKLSPQQAAVHKASLLSNVTEWAKNPTPTDQVKEGWVQNTRELTRQLRYGTVNDAQVANNVFGSPDVAKFVVSLTPAQRQTALSPLVRGTGTAATTLVAGIRQQLASPDTLLNTKFSTVELVVSPLTGLIDVKASGVQRPSETNVLGLVGRFIASQTQREGALKQVEQSVKQINQLVQAHATGQSLLGNKEGIVEYSTRLLSGGLAVPAVSGNAPPQAAQFVQDVTPLLANAGSKLGVDPALLAAQLGLETGWGKFVIKGTNNLGNIKDFSGGGVAAFDKAEGSNSKYKVYSSIEDFVDSYATLLQKNWPGVVGAGSDAERFARALKPGEQGGYATDKDYIKKLVASYNSVRSQ